MSRQPDPRRTDRLRAVPLESVLRACGARPDRDDRGKWHTSQGPLSVNGAKFFNWRRSRGGGGAVDLIMHLDGLSFGQALQWLESRFPQPAAAPAPAASPRPALRLPPSDSNRLGHVRDYLILRRSIPAETVGSLIDSGALYADDKANAVFLLFDADRLPVGAELRGAGPCRWRGMAPGSRKDLGFFSVAPAVPSRRIILCESAIDAVSCFALHPDARCISTSGTRPDPPWLPCLLTLGLPVYCGFDADDAGERTALRMTAAYPSIQRLRPSEHDWNDLLRSLS